MDENVDHDELNSEVLKNVEKNTKQEKKKEEPALEDICFFNSEEKVLHINVKENVSPQCFASLNRCKTVVSFYTQ